MPSAGSRTRHSFDKHRQLKYFFNAGAGLDHFFNNPDMAGKLPEGMKIIRLEDAGMGQQMADFCRHQVFDWMYGFARYRDQQVRQEWRGWRERYALERPNMPVGVLGLGVLGTAVARSFSADGFKVYGYARTPRQVEGVEFEPDLHRFLQKTRVLIILAPSTAETQHIIRAETLAMMPKGAYLINIARGALVNEPDLIAALDSGHLDGACLDVFEQEPLPAGHPLWTHPKVVVTPHASAPTLVHPALDQILAKIARLEKGLPITGLADASNS